MPGRDGQAQTVADTALGHPGPEPARALGNQLLRITVAVVNHFDGPAVDRDLDRRLAVAQPVDDEVGQDPLDPARVGGDRYLRADLLDHHAVRGERLLHPQPADRRPDEGAQPDQLEVRLFDAGVEPGDLEQVLDQPAQDLGTVADEFARPAGWQQLGCRGQAGHRRTQVVRNVRGEPAL